MMKRKQSRRRMPQMLRFLHMHAFLEELLKRRGSVNLYMRFVYGHGNRCTRPPNNIRPADQHRYCELRTQCHATRMTMNYFFGEPVLVPRYPFRVCQILDYTYPSHNVVNVEIAIPSHGYFLGHVFNVILLKRRDAQVDIFCVQSYLLQYTVGFEEYDEAKLELLLRTYYGMFFADARGDHFSDGDARMWPILTDAPLVGYYGQSLIGAPKPPRGSSTIRIASFHTDNLAEHLREKYQSLLYDTLIRVFQLDSQEKYEDFFAAFGEQSQGSVTDRVQAQLGALQDMAI